MALRAPTPAPCTAPLRARSPGELHVGTGQLGIFAEAATLAALFGHAGWGQLADGRSSLHALRAVYVLGSLIPILYCVARPWAAGAAAVTESPTHTGLGVVGMMAAYRRLVASARPRPDR